MMVLIIIVLLFMFNFTRMLILNIHREIAYLGLDIFNYFRLKKWKIWNGFGLNIYIGMFGKGKTLSAVDYVVRNAKRYNLNVISNIKLYGVSYVPLINYQQIINAPANTIILIDEISTVFNSRSWKDFNINLLFQLLQCRKNKKEIVATAQRFHHVDKLLRDITYNVIDCNKIWRFQHNEYYDAWDYENALNSKLISRCGNKWFFVKNKNYKQYDTDELIDNAKRTDFISNDEILNSRGNLIINELGIEKPSRYLKKRLKK